ncbi:MAG: hypothetical protein K8L97_24240 [Anaerolineae bacterium]|nr:hypothetical protein [Anaerolineae bacterium]
MPKLLTLKYGLLLLMLCLLLAALPVYAQEGEATAEATTAEAATAETEPAQATGLSTLVLLMGLGGVLIVGGTMLMRENSRNDSAAE